jgi:hypothetical protein
MWLRFRSASIGDLLQTNFDWQRRVSEEDYNSAVSELNTRFHEHAIGYQFESGQIIKVDSQLIHAEVVKPALALLSAPEYAGANAEFLRSCNKTYPVARCVVA